MMELRTLVLPSPTLPKDLKIEQQLLLKLKVLYNIFLGAL